MSQSEIYTKNVEDAFLQVGGSVPEVIATETSLIFPEDISYEAWADYGRKLSILERSVGWWLGDWLIFGEHPHRKWGEKYKEAERLTKRSYQGLADMAYVARQFDFSRRREKVSFSSHREVASLAPDVADNLLSRAEEGDWGNRQVRAEASKFRTREKLLGSAASDDRCGIADLFGLVQQGRKFGCIYADPPWVFDNQSTRGATSNHYDGLTVEELCALPVRELAADDAHLHLWTVNAFLFECPKIFDAWGFDFKSSFVWAKSEMGIGNYWRNSHEILLTAVRGDATRFDDHSIKSWIECGRSQHSEKPWIVRDFLKRTSPGPRLEMFARTEATGWTVWGNDIERSLFSKSLDASFAEVAHG